MTSTLFRGPLITADRLIDDALLAVDGETIAYAGPTDGPDAPSADGAREVHGYLMPGLIDVHCHGGGGASFPDATSLEDVRTAVAEHRRHGTTSLVASTVTADGDTLLERTALLRRACESGDLVGIHWEGPFISCERCGAQDPNLIVAPDADLTRRLCEVAGPYAFAMTLAPEKEGVTGVVDVLIEAGALPSFGHTDAGPEETETAVAAAATQLSAAGGAPSARASVTHLFNGMRALHHRDPGPIPALLAAAQRGELVVELIADGAHVAPSLVRHTLELLGRDAVVFVTDAMAATGMADGTYRLGSMDVTVRDGTARLTNGDSIAGGTSHLLDQIRTMVGAGVALLDAVYVCTVGPARLLGRTDIGTLTSGARADVLITDENLQPITVLHGGANVAGVR
ncbi:MAG: amidohydrolase family protein [Bowdeniella nasicola]|nr:amidohydrolase family protein [Bowdeniella nasicola]